MTWILVLIEGALTATIASDAIANEIVRLAAVATAATVLAGLSVKWFRAWRRAIRWVRDFSRKAMTAVEELGHLAKWREEVDDRLAVGSSRFEDITQRLRRVEDTIAPDVTVRHTFSPGPEGGEGAMGATGPRGPRGPRGPAHGEEPAPPSGP